MINYQRFIALTSKEGDYIQKIEKLEKRCTSLETLIANQKQEIKELKNKLQKTDNAM